MPIIINQLVPANNALAGYTIAKELARQMAVHFAAVRGVGVGIGPGSCCAALAINPVPGFVAVNPVNGGAALPYSVVYGNSQMAAGGLVAEHVGGHAERAALTAAAQHGAGLYTLPHSHDAVLFVELTPCAACQNWLNGNGGGVPNPFDGTINAAGAGGNGTNLNVWFRWVYPGDGGYAAMQAFHALNQQAELNDINGATW